MTGDDRRVERALKAADPYASLYALVLVLRDENAGRERLYDLLDRARVRHAADSDERAYDAILDVLDCVMGFCPPSRALFPDPTP